MRKQQKEKGGGREWVGEVSHVHFSREPKGQRDRETERRDRDQTHVFFLLWCHELTSNWTQVSLFACTHTHHGADGPNPTPHPDWPGLRNGRSATSVEAKINKRWAYLSNIHISNTRPGIYTRMDDRELMRKTSNTPVQTVVFLKLGMSLAFRKEGNEERNGLSANTPLCLCKKSKRLTAACHSLAWSARFPPSSCKKINKYRHKKRSEQAPVSPFSALGSPRERNMERNMERKRLDTFAWRMRTTTRAQGHKDTGRPLQQRSWPNWPPSLSWRVFLLWILCCLVVGVGVPVPSTQWYLSGKVMGLCMFSSCIRLLFQSALFSFLHLLPTFVQQRKCKKRKKSMKVRDRETHI